jgi:hypothetical protein
MISNQWILRTDTEALAIALLTASSMSLVEDPVSSICL